MAPPADQLIDPAPARASDYFTRGADRARAGFPAPAGVHRTGRAATQIALLVYLVRRPPARLRRAGARWWHGALAGAAIAVAQSAVVLPFTIVNRIRAIDVGLNTRSWLGWAWDWVLSVSINAVLMGLLAVALLWLMRRLPRWWWAPGSVVVVVVAVGWTLFSPVVLDPLFNRFEPLRAEPLRSQVLALAREAGVDACEVQVMDASRRTTGANAYVAGLGHTKRIVLYDNLLQATSRAPSSSTSSPTSSATSTTATCRRGLLYVAIVAPFGMLAVALLTRRLTPGTGPVVLPALALSILLVSTGIGWISNPLSRQVEARADTFALRTTNEPGRADRAPAPARDPQRLRSRPARLGHGGVRDAPTADGSDRERVSRAAARASTSCGLLR